MTTQHTQGPWEWDGTVWQYDQDQEAPWLVQFPWRSRDSKTILSGGIKCTSKADAQLIATAPELLEALRDIIEGTRLDEFNRNDDGLLDAGGYNFTKRIAAARAAIAKATGGAT